MTTTRDRQARCAALGFDPGPIDGVLGPRTRGALARAANKRNLPLFDPSGLHRVHWHWDAGSGAVTNYTKSRYHAVVDRDARLHDGNVPPEEQSNYRPGKSGCSHTRNANTGALGICCAGMHGAVHSPFQWGEYPLTQEQIDEMLIQTAEWCLEYCIPVSRYSTLSHAEVQATLGIEQRGKWDITVLPGMSKPADPVFVGDKLRARLLELRPGARQIT